MGLKQKVRVVTVRFSCFNARKLYQIGVNMVAYLMPKLRFCQERRISGLFGYNPAVWAGKPPFLQPTNFLEQSA